MNMDNIIAADSSAYPEIRVQGENRRLAEQISSAFGGGSGEFGTIAEYVYQSIIFKENFPEYSAVLMKIAKVEMHHLYMVGEIISKLGGQPVYGWYSGGEPIYWNGGSVNYSNDLASALIYDLNGEQKAYSSYVSLARQSGDRYVFAALTRIALDEMIHTSLFKSMINKLRHTESHGDEHII